MPNISESEAQYVELGRWDELDDIEQSRIINFSSGESWESFVNIEPGYELYSGTSINGGGMIIQSNRHPSNNISMMAVHRFDPNPERNGSLYMEFEDYGNESFIHVKDTVITIDWAYFQCQIET